MHRKSLATRHARALAALLLLVGPPGATLAQDVVQGPAGAVAHGIPAPPALDDGPSASFAGSAARLTLGPVAGAGAVDAPERIASDEAVVLDATLALEVRGLLAQLRLVQSFRNGTDAWRDGRYTFPMAEGATLLGLEIRTGGRTVRGTVVERAEADAAFTAAAAAGRVAAVVDVARPNLFTTRIASIAPGDTVSVTLDVLLPVDADAGAYGLVLPTTLVPRYVNEDVADAADIAAAVLPASVARGPRVSLRARVIGHEPVAVTSPTHRTGTDGDAVTIDAPADRDIRLRWPGNASTAPAGRLHAVAHAGHRYVQLLLEPPSPSARDGADPVPHRPRELVLVLDRSGSMAGEPIRAARAAVEAALDRLRPGDAFNVIAFDDTVRSAFDAAVPAGPAALAHARRFVRGLTADGGTEIRPALERALASSADGAERLVQIVFLTDGAIGYEDALLGDIERGLGRRRLFTLGIGSSPNRWFLERAATVGRGTATFIADAQGVESGVGRLLERLAEPVLTDLVAGPSSGSLMLFPDPVPDLYADRPVMLVARLDAGVDEIVVTGDRAGTRWRRAWPVPAALDAPEASDASDPSGGAPAAAGVVPAIASHWAARRIAHLLDDQRGAADPERHRDEILAIALEAGLASPYTSFVAVAEAIVRPANVRARATEVASLAPAGTVMHAIAMPRGALGLPGARRLALLLAAGGAALALAWAALHRRRA